MQYKEKLERGRLGFSLIELSIVLIIISVLMVAVIKGSDLIGQAKLNAAQQKTTDSPVLEINDLAVWFEPTLPNSFLDIETLDGGLISTWNDVSGINPKLPNNASQATTGSQPTYVANGINGLPTLEFDGISDYLDVTNSDLISISPNITIFVVFKVLPKTSVNSVTGILSKDESGGITNPSYEIQYSETGKTVGFGITDSSNVRSGIGSSSTFVNGTSVITSSSYDYLNLVNGIKLYINGTLESSAAATLKIGQTTANLRIGRQKLAFSGRNFKGQISEIIIYNRVLSNQERRDVEQYLGSKYQITVL